MHALTKMKYAAGFLLGALALVMGGEAAAKYILFGAAALAKSTEEKTAR